MFIMKMDIIKEFRKTIQAKRRIVILGSSGLLRADEAVDIEKTIRRLTNAPKITLNTSWAVFISRIECWNANFVLVWHVLKFLSIDGRKS